MDKAESLGTLSYAKNRIKKSVLKKHKNIQFCLKKIKIRRIQPFCKTEKSWGFMLITNMKTRVQSSYFTSISSLICHQNFSSKPDLPVSVYNNAYIALLAVVYLNTNANMDQNTLLALLFLAPVQTYAANPSESWHLPKNRAHQCVSWRGAEIAKGTLGLVSLLTQWKHLMHVTQLCLQVFSSHPRLG